MHSTSPKSRRTRRLRVVVGLVAALAYALPAFVVVGSALGHGASHMAGQLAEQAREQRRIAATLGLTHPTVALDQARPEGPPGRLASIGHESWSRANVVVHEHDGSRHAHSGIVAELLIAADGGGDGLEARIQSPTTLSAHVPPGAVRVVSLIADDLDARLVPPLPLTGTDRSPPVEPPRA